MAHIEIPADEGARAGVGVDRSAAPGRVRLAIGAVLVFAVALALLAGGASLLNDPDTLWHIAVGQDIWQTKTLPHVDAYSHTFAGAPWIAKEWLSQVLLAGAYGAGGWNGVVIFTTIIIGVVIAQVYWGLSAFLKPTIAAAITVGAFAFASDVFIARPHIVVLPLIILFVHRLWASACNKAAPGFWLLAVMAVWSNLHASFTFGFAAAFIAFLHYLHQTRDFSSAKTLRWVIFLGLCPLASMVHPYGFQSIWSTVTIVESEALPYVTEWRPFSAAENPTVAFALLAAIFALLAGRFRTQVATAAFVCLLLHMYLTHARFVYLLFLLTPLLLVRDVAGQFPALSFKAYGERFAPDRFERMLAERAHAIPAVLAMLFAAAAGAYAAVARSAPPPSAYPVLAIEAARAHGVHGQVMNEYNFGGALIFEGVPTFVDGRADRLFQNGFIPEMARAMGAGGDEILRHQIDEYAIGWTLLKPTDGRVRHLDEDPAWMRIYEDDFAVAHARVIAAP